MQQSEFQQIREWYQQFEDAVLFYRMDGTALWQNHAAPCGRIRTAHPCHGMPRTARRRPARFPSRQGSVLYLLRQKQCRIGGTPVILCRSAHSRKRNSSGPTPTDVTRKKTGSPPYARRYLASPTPSVRCIRIWMNPATRSPG